MQPPRQKFEIRIGGILGFIVLVLLLVGLFFIAKGVFRLLSFIAPLLLIGALIVNYQTVLGYIRWIWDLLRTRPVWGVIAILLTIFGFPVVCAILFGKAFLDRRISSYREKIRKHTEGELTEYEDITEDEKTLDLKSISPEAQKGNIYDDFFDDERR